MKQHNSPPSLEQVIDAVLPDSHPLKTQDMNDITFKPDEYCLFPNEELNSILDLLRENGYIAGMLSMHGHDAIKYDGYKLYSVFSHKIIERENSKELTRPEFIYKATRGKENAPVEFDGSKPFEVSDDGVEWKRVEDPSYIMHYVGVSLSGKHVIEGDLGFVRWNYVRNVPEPFNASMLEVGEYMVVTKIGPQEGHLIRKTGVGIFFDMDDITGFSDDSLTGRRVKVNITTEEY